jgi:hypothetical protein
LARRVHAHKCVFTLAVLLAAHLPLV